MPELILEQEEMEDGVVMIDASGFLDAFTVEDFREKLYNLFENNKNRIIVKLNNLNYISSAGAGAFIEANQIASDAGGRLVILSPSQNVYEVFELLGLTKILHFADDLESAKATVKA